MLLEDDGLLELICDDETEFDDGSSELLSDEERLPQLARANVASKIVALKNFENNNLDAPHNNIFSRQLAMT